MVLQLLAATEKTGQLEVRGEGEEHRGFLGVSGGRLVSAQFEDEDGDLALGAVFAIDRGDFEFLPQDRIERTDLSGDVEEIIERAGVERDRIRSIRDAVPNDRMRFRLSERATERGEITLAPQQWRALLLVDGRRDVVALARELQMPRLAAQQLLAALVRAGLVDAVAPPEGGPIEEGAPRAYRRLPPMQPLPPTTSGEQVVLRGRLPDFPLETIVQLLAETKKTGRLEVRAGRDSSTLGMADGRLVSARAGEEEGELGLGAAFTAQEGEFDFVPMTDAPAADLSGALDSLLDRAANVRDRIVAIRALIPNERARFTMSERATARSEIVLTPEQWRVLLGVNGERDVVGIADHLRMRRLTTMMVLADLVRGGYVDVLPVTEDTWPYVERRKGWPAPPPVAAAPVAEAAPGPAPSPWEAAAPPAAAEEAVAEEPVFEEPLEETPLDHEPEADDRLAAIESVVGPAEPAPPPAAWEPPPLFAAAPPEPEPEPVVEPEPAFDPRLAAFPEEEAPPAWETPSWEPMRGETPPQTPPGEPSAEIDPRLAAFGTLPAQPEAPSWEAPAGSAWGAPVEPAREAPALEAPPKTPAAEAAPKAREPIAINVRTISRGMPWALGLLSLLLAATLVADGSAAGIVPGVTVDIASPAWLVYVSALVLLVVASRAVHGGRFATRLLLVMALIYLLERAFTPFALRLADPISLGLHLLAALVALALALASAAALRATRPGRSPSPSGPAPALALAFSPTAPAVANTRAYCPKCGGEVQVDDASCKRCGAAQS